MKNLILVDQATKTLKLYSSALASAAPYPSTVQVIPAADAGPEEWAWADWVLFGFSLAAGERAFSMEHLLARLPTMLLEGKAFAIFQVQARTDPPISTAYGIGMARNLRARGMRLVAPPAVFFQSHHASETEGELLRAMLWLNPMVKHLMRLSHKDEK